MTTHGVCGHRKRVCTESWLWEKNTLPHQGIKPALVARRSDALPTELHPHQKRVSFWGTQYLVGTFFFFFFSTLCQTETFELPRPEVLCYNFTSCWSVMALCHCQALLYDSGTKHTVSWVTTEADRLWLYCQAGSCLMSVMRIAHARFLSDTPNCLMVMSKSFCRMTVPDTVTVDWGL